jgi:DNA-binding IscR family transcriptional regulator
MRLSRRSEYGLRALVDLVRNDGNAPVPLATLAQRNVLPM